MSRTKQAGSKDVAPMIRGAFKRAVKALEDGGRPLSTIIKESLEDKPLDTLRAISSFCPKELEVTQVPARIEDMNDEQLEQLASLAASVISQSGEAAKGSGTPQPDSVH